MKTLILTSNGMDVKEGILNNLPKSPSESQLAFITTASKVEDDTSYVEKDRRELIASGFKIEEVDIEGKSEPLLREILSKFDVIFVEGGNTFYLLKAVKESGFDKVVKELIQKGIVYVGVSAGTIISGPSIETSTWLGNDSNIVGLKDLTAMNLVDFNFVVHYEQKQENLISNKIAQSKYPLKTLTDKQAVVVKDGKYSLIG